MGLRYEGTREGTGCRFSVERVIDASLGKEGSFLGLAKECNLIELHCNSGLWGVSPGPAEMCALPPLQA